MKECMISAAPEVQVDGLGLTEEVLESIPKLDKDTLMPKDLSG